ncbi:MAG: hypothetical protein QXU27_01795 [Candidatus Anstonellales archaeon]
MKYMVTSASERIAKYSVRLNPELYRNRYNQVKDIMVEEASAKQAVIADYQASVKQLLLDHGVIPELVIVFMRAAMKLLSLQQKFSGEVLQKESIFYLNAIYCKIKNQFTDAIDVQSILEGIANLAGISWTAPTKCYE